MSRKGIFWLACFGLLVLFVLATWFRMDPIEANLTEQAQDVLATNDLSNLGASVSFNGRDAHITGVLASTDQQATLEDAMDFWGVRQVITDDLRIAESANIHVQQGGEGFVLRGTVPSEALRQTIVDAAQRRFQPTPVHDQLTVSDGVIGGDHFAALLGALPDMGDVSGATLQATNATLTLTGAANSEARKTHIGTTLAGLLPEGMSLENALSVAAPSEAQQSLDALLAEETIQFATGTATLTARSQQILNNMATVIQQSDAGHIEIGGHTDNTGNAAANQGLSQRRAEAVRQYLIGRGIAADRLSAAGYGPTRPLMSNDTEAGRRANRRVEFRIR